MGNQSLRHNVLLHSLKFLLYFSEIFCEFSLKTFSHLIISEFSHFPHSICLHDLFNLCFIIDGKFSLLLSQNSSQMFVFLEFSWTLPQIFLLIFIIIVAYSLKFATNFRILIFFFFFNQFPEILKTFLSSLFKFLSHFTQISAKCTSPEKSPLKFL